MSTSISLSSLKNFIAPGISVSGTVQVSAADTAGLIQQIVNKYGLRMIEKGENAWKLQVEGMPVVPLSQTKVVLGLKPDRECYERLHSYLTVTKAGDGSLQVESHERIIAGTPAERKVYREVLEARLNRFIAYLKMETNH